MEEKQAQQAVAKQKHDEEEAKEDKKIAEEQAKIAAEYEEEKRRFKGSFHTFPQFYCTNRQSFPSALSFLLWINLVCLNHHE